MGLRIKSVSDKFVFIALDNTTKMSYHDSDRNAIKTERGAHEPL